MDYLYVLLLYAIIMFTWKKYYSGKGLYISSDLVCFVHFPRLVFTASILQSIGKQKCGLIKGSTNLLDCDAYLEKCNKSTVQDSVGRIYLNGSHATLCIKSGLHSDSFVLHAQKSILMTEKPFRKKYYWSCSKIYKPQIYG